MSRAAQFWEPQASDDVRCTLCPHACLIKEGREGLCKARGNRGGELVSLVYARAATVVSDEIEKKPLYHFHPGTRVLSLGTLGCNVLCSGCQNWQISHASARAEAEKLPLLTPHMAVDMAIRHKLAGVAWTYNEPSVWLEYVHDVSAAFRAAGLYTAFISAGYLTEEALDYVAPVLDAFKLDLKAPDAKGWSWLTKVKDPEPAMRAAVRAKNRHGCHVEVVSNLIPGLNDDEASVGAMASWILRDLGPKTPWHLTRFRPDFELSYLSPTPIRTLDRAATLARKTGLQFVYVGNVPGHGSRHTVCPACGRTVIHRGDRGVEEIWVREGRCASCGEDLQVIH